MSENFEEVKYLSQIFYEGIPTYYFFHKKSKTLIPVCLAKTGADRLYDKHPSQPDSTETFKKLVLSLGIKVLCVKVYLYQEGNFYTYLCVKNSEEEIDINTSFIDALSLGKTLGSPIFFAEEVIKSCGFKVTKRMIEKALLE